MTSSSSLSDFILSVRKISGHLLNLDPVLRVFFDQFFVIFGKIFSVFLEQIWLFTLTRLIPKVIHILGVLYLASNEGLTEPV